MDDSVTMLKECEVCCMKFEWLYEKQLHMSQTHPDLVPALTCCICNRSFSKYCRLINHFRVHSGLRPFTCLKCDKTFVQLSNIIGHLNICHNIVYRDLSVELKKKMYSSTGDLPSIKLLKQLYIHSDANQSYLVSSTSASPAYHPASCDQSVVSSPLGTINNPHEVFIDVNKPTPSHWRAMIANHTVSVDETFDSVLSRSGRVVKPKLSFSPSRSPMRKSQLEQRLVRKYLRMQSPSAAYRNNNRLLLIDTSVKLKRLTSPRCDLTTRLNAVCDAKAVVVGMSNSCENDVAMEVSSSVTDAALPATADSEAPVTCENDSSFQSKPSHIEKAHFALTQIKNTISQHSANKVKLKPLHDERICKEDCSEDVGVTGSPVSRCDVHCEQMDQELFSGSPFKIESKQEDQKLFSSPNGKDRGLFSLFSNLCDDKTRKIALRNESDLLSTIEELKTKMSQSNSTDQLKTKLITPRPDMPLEKRHMSLCEPGRLNVDAAVKRRRKSYSHKTANRKNMTPNTELKSPLTVSQLRFIKDMQALIAFRQRVYLFFLVFFPKVRPALHMVKKETPQVDEFVFSVSSSLIHCPSCHTCCKIPSPRINSQSPTAHHDRRSSNVVTKVSRSASQCVCVENNNKKTLDQPCPQCEVKSPKKRDDPGDEELKKTLETQSSECDSRNKLCTADHSSSIICNDPLTHCHRRVADTGGGIHYTAGGRILHLPVKGFEHSDMNGLINNSNDLSVHVNTTSLDVVSMTECTSHSREVTSTPPAPVSPRVNSTQRTPRDTRTRGNEIMYTEQTPCTHVNSGPGTVAESLDYNIDSSVEQSCDDGCGALSDNVRDIEPVEPYTQPNLSLSKDIPNSQLSQRRYNAELSINPCDISPNPNISENEMNFSNTVTNRTNREENEDDLKNEVITRSSKEDNDLHAGYLAATDLGALQLAADTSVFNDRLNSNCHYNLEQSNTYRKFSNTAEEYDCNSDKGDSSSACVFEKAWLSEQAIVNGKVSGVDTCVVSSKTCDILPNKLDTHAPCHVNNLDDACLRELDRVPPCGDNMDHVPACGDNVDCVPACGDNMDHVPACGDNMDHVPACGDNVDYVPACGDNVDRVPACGDNIDCVPVCCDNGDAGMCHELSTACQSECEREGGSNAACSSRSPGAAVTIPDAPLTCRHASCNVGSGDLRSVRVEVCRSPGECLRQLKVCMLHLLPLIFPDIGHVCGQVDCANIDAVLKNIMSTLTHRRNALIE